MEDFLERHGNLEIEGKQVFESQEDEPIAMCLQVKMSEAIFSTKQFMSFVSQMWAGPSCEQLLVWILVK